jgi:D-beta-D-heptose 7-phosphate kinase/D-beta-D-heptose 1-phosphate adenosyltransferase
MSKVIFCNGAFDLLHEGHIELLKYAKGLGDRLVVGLDSDRRIAESKGPSRPINPINIRRAIMEQLKPVDIVEEFDSDQQLIELLKKHKPAVRVIGSDWRGRPVVGAEYSESLVYFERNNGQSTTNTIQSIIDRR